MHEFWAAFTSVFVCVFFLIPIANHVGLHDKPNYRKIHKGSIPIVGGIAILLATTLTALFFIPYSKDLFYLLVACMLLTITGIIDDRYDLNFPVRLLIQAICALVVVWGANINLISLGNVHGFGNIYLGALETPITVLAVVAMINAFNMIDGLDGLAAGLGLLSACSILFLLHGQVSNSATTILYLLLGAVSAYLLLNLNILPKIQKIFMGDAGSMLLGLIITAFLIRYSQAPKQVFSPVTSLWLVSIPLMDATLTCIRRYRHGKSLFHPDKTHIHHILQRSGFGPSVSLLILLGFQAISSTIGMLLELNIGNDIISFMGFVILSVLYLQFVKHAFKISKYFRKRKN